MVPVDVYTIAWPVDDSKLKMLVVKNLSSFPGSMWYKESINFCGFNLLHTTNQCTIKKCNKNFQSNNT